MLKLLRNKKVSKKIFYGLAIIIIPAFVVWGSSSVMKKDKGPSVAGRIFDKKVSIDAFQKAFETWKIQIRYQYGEKAAEMAAFVDPLQATWERLIIMHEIKRRGLRVTDKEVVQNITNMPFLQRNGRFDKQAYELFLKYSLGVSGRQFEEALRQNLLVYKLSAMVTKDVSVSDSDIREAYENESVQTALRYVAFPYDGYLDDVTITEEDISAFYASSKEALRVPPHINTSYVGFEFDDEELGLTRDEMNVKIRNALSTSRSKGLKLAAQELNFEIKETGFFGFEDPIPEFGWLPQLSRILFDLPVLSFSKIIQTSRGMYVFQITKKKPAYIPELKEAVPRIKEILTAQKSKELAKQKAQEFLDLTTTKGRSFDEAAQQLGAEAVETEEFTREAYISELGMAPNLKEAAFKLTEGETPSNAIENEQSFLVIKSLMTPTLDEEEFEKEKEAFGQKVLANKRSATFNAYFISLRDRAGLRNFMDGESLRQISR